MFEATLQKSIFRYTFNFLLFIVLINLFSRGFSVNLAKTINYSNWYAEFTKFEADQVEALAKYNDSGICINGVNNLNDWEFLYEIPIHLKFLYGLDANTNLYEGKAIAGKYIFSRSSFDSYSKLDDVAKLNSKLVLSKSYAVGQIDPLVFRERFTMKPVETILNPPFQKDGYSYYWEIRQIQK